MKKQHIQEKFEPFVAAEMDGKPHNIRLSNERVALLLHQGSLHYYIDESETHIRFWSAYRGKNVWVVEELEVLVREQKGYVFDTRLQKCYILEEVEATENQKQVNIDIAMVVPCYAGDGCKIIYDPNQRKVLIYDDYHPRGEIFDVKNTPTGYLTFDFAQEVMYELEQSPRDVKVYRIHAEDGDYYVISGEVIKRVKYSYVNQREILSLVDVPATHTLDVNGE